MTTIERVKQAEQTGQYHFPFTQNSFMANAVMNELITFQDYISIEENWFAQMYLGKRYRYTLEEMKSSWDCILIQRKTLLSALMVVDGRFKGINQGLRLFNIL